MPVIRWGGAGGGAHGDYSSRGGSDTIYTSGTPHRSRMPARKKKRNKKTIRTDVTDMLESVSVEGPEKSRYFPFLDDRMDTHTFSKLTSLLIYPN